MASWKSFSEEFAQRGLISSPLIKLLFTPGRCILKDLGRLIASFDVDDSFL